MFAYRLPNALGNAAMDLTFHQHWVQKVSKIIHHRIPRHLYRARIGVNFNFANMRAIWKRSAVQHRISRVLHQILAARSARHIRNFQKCGRQIRTRRAKALIIKHNLIRIHVQLIR